MDIFRAEIGVDLWRRGQNSIAATFGASTQPLYRGEFLSKKLPLIVTS
jgi:hypothetical protein